MVCIFSYQVVLYMQTVVCLSELIGYDDGLWPYTQPLVSFLETPRNNEWAGKKFFVVLNLSAETGVEPVTFFATDKLHQFR